MRKVDPRFLRSGLYFFGFRCLAGFFFLGFSEESFGVSEFFPMIFLLFLWDIAISTK